MLNPENLLAACSIGPEKVRHIGRLQQACACNDPAWQAPGLNP